jgi:hypothetical protein
MLMFDNIPSRYANRNLTFGNIFAIYCENISWKPFAELEIFRIFTTREAVALRCAYKIFDITKYFFEEFWLRGGFSTAAENPLIALMLCISVI